MNNSLQKTLFLVLVLAPVCHGADPLKVRNVTEQTTTVRRETLAFPARPVGINSSFLVGPPEITIDTGLASKLGGVAITELVRAPIENLLHNSGRFRVSNKPGPYLVSAKLSNLSISQITDKKKAAIGQVFKNVLAKTGKFDGSPILDAALEADLSKDELQMTIQCAVSVQIRDQDGILLAGQTGEVVRKDTTRNIKAELAGIQFSSGATREPVSNSNDAATQLVQFQSRVIELATFEALLLLLPDLDAKLAAGLTATSAASPETGPAETNPKAPSTEAPTAPSAIFCPKCGGKAEGDANFCTKCGTKLSR
jgi:hypothetical protein